MVAIAGGVLASGCGDNGSDDAGTPASGAAAAQTAAATLRAELTTRLTDQIYLTAGAVAEAVRGGTDQPQFAAAVDAAKANAGALAATIAEVYGPGPQERLEGLWSQQVDAFAAYAKAKLVNDEAAVQKALADLDRGRAELAAGLTDTVGELARRDAAEELRVQIQALITAADGTLDKAAGAYTELADAGARAPVGAELIAKAIVSDKADRFDAEPDAAAAAMRAGLTGRLAADAYLMLLRANAIVRFGANSDSATAAAEAADANAVAFTQLLSSVYGEDAGQRALKLWRVQARLLAGYARAKVAKDDDAATAALRGLDTWRDELSNLLAGFNPTLNADRLAAQLAPFVDARTAAVRADSSHSEKTYARQQEAAARGAELAATLARGISAQYPEKFGAE